MNGYTLSEAADADLQEILSSSIKHWGLARAERYILELHEAFENLAAFPHIGSDVGHLRAEYFRLRHVSHSVFYRKNDVGVLIVRVLHQKQLPENYL